jgi:hypothetical protein
MYIVGRKDYLDIIRNPVTTDTYLDSLSIPVYSYLELLDQGEYIRAYGERNAIRN